MTASLYIHIPFCSSKCDYCDFFSVRVNDSDSSLLDAYIKTLLEDIKGQIEFFKINRIPSIYIGGGTPSVLGAGRMEIFLSGLKSALGALFNTISEFTTEANPESADEAFIAACRKGGVNRISLGVQSFNEKSLKAAGRKCNQGLKEKNLALASRHFQDSLSIDLIAGLPFQTSSVLLDDINRALDFSPSHISLYSLSLDEETPLGKKLFGLGPQKLSLPAGDNADRLWIKGRNALEKAGFAQYEVSNFAKPGKACIHNIRYWRMENWIGAGPASSGTIIEDHSGTGRRYTYPCDIRAYLNASPPQLNSACIETLDRETLIKESIFMGFRYLGGPDTELFKKRFGCSIESLIPKTIASWSSRGFFEKAQPYSLAPSRNGLLFLNSFIADSFAELA